MIYFVTCYLLIIHKVIFECVCHSCILGTMDTGSASTKYHLGMCNINEFTILTVLLHYLMLELLGKYKKKFVSHMDENSLDFCPN